MSGVGEAVVLRPGEGREFTIGDDRVTVKTEADRENPPFALVEYTGAPNPGPPMHVHKSFEECWFILEGEVDFHLGPQRTRSEAGSFLLVPRGVPHTFQVVGEQPARWIGVFSPSHYMALIEELGALLRANPSPLPYQVQALFAQYDTYIV